MPVTPFHMGPALFLKPMAKRKFSLIVFGISQVAIDLEPLVYIIRGNASHHGFMHTYIAAVVVAVLVAAFLRPFCKFLLHMWNRILPVFRLGWLRDGDNISRKVMITSALIGTMSHVFIDSLTHYDVHPFAPFWEGTSLRDVVTLVQVYKICAAMFAVGGVWWLAMKWRARRGG